MMYFNSLTKNGNYPTASVKLNNGEYVTIQNVEFYWSGKKEIDFYCFDSKNIENLDNVTLKVSDVSFIKWEY